MARNAPDYRKHWREAGTSAPLTGTVCSA